jgi:predicted DCC family thiol-disulfide oxidoreductase YuxK
MVRPMVTDAAPATPALPGGMDRPVIFFDGVCPLCNRFVDIVLRADRGGVLRFAPLQGETARALRPARSESAEEWSVLYLDEHGLHDQSDAVIQVYRRLGGPWRLLALIRLVPRRIRNPVYRVIARNRYRWFGRRSACRLPSAQERDRFLP